MRFSRRPLLLCSALLLAAGSFSHAAQAPNPITKAGTVPNFRPVTDAEMRSPNANDWLMYRGNYAGWGYSALDQINKLNVKGLTLVWSRSLAPGGNQATPLVRDGIMYLANAGDVYQAIDALTGNIIWEYRHPLPDLTTLHNAQGQKKRSIVLYDDKIYSVTWNNDVIALDARTGALVFKMNRGGDGYVTNSSGPLVVNGMIVAGSTANGFGGGYVTGHDARNGEELWRNEVIPHPGQPGDETWGGTPFESRWHTGVWGHLTYDPELDLLYYGSSGVAPAAEIERKAPGATLSGSDTRFAVRPKTGEIVWRHQTMPRDNWDQECTFEMMVINANVNPDASTTGMMSINPDARKGPRKTLTGIPCKTGIAWSFDAANGEFLWAKSTVEQNVVSRIGPKGEVTPNEDVVMKEFNKTYRICPTYTGGRDWPMGAYNPKSGLMYVPMSNLCHNSTARSDRASTPANGYNTNNVPMLSTGKDKVGRIDAVNVETGKTEWTWETRVGNYSPMLTTGGGLVFNGGLDRYLRAFDADNGTLLWQTRLPQTTAGGIASYSVGGKQYIAVVAGSGALAGGQVQMTPEADMGGTGDAVYVFALSQ